LIFFRKTVIHSIKTLEEFNSVYDPEMIRKIEETGKSKIEDPNQKRMRGIL